MRARNMQALTDAAQRRHPGVVIYGIGDAAHRLHASGHNEDDTPGSLAELSDSDSNPEHRAIDLMLGSAFSKADAEAFVAALLADPAARARLYYIIWNGHIWSRSSGWVRKVYTGSDQHTDHVHVSGWAADDENAAGWPAVEGEDEMTYTDAQMRAFAWQYIGGGIPAGMSALGVFNKTYEQTRDTLAATVAVRAELAAVRTVLDTLAATIKAGGGSVDTLAISTKIDQAVNAAVAAIRAETRDAVADLGEGGSAQVRADLTPGA